MENFEIFDRSEVIWYPEGFWIGVGWPNECAVGIEVIKGVGCWAGDRVLEHVGDAAKLENGDGVGRVGWTLCWGFWCFAISASNEIFVIKCSSYTPNIIIFWWWNLIGFYSLCE